MKIRRINVATKLILALVVVLALPASAARAEAFATSEEALIELAGRGHLTLVRLILDQGANINARNKGGETALIRAAENGHVAVVKLLLNKGADVNAKDM